MQTFFAQQSEKEKKRSLYFCVEKVDKYEKKSTENFLEEGWRAMPGLFTIEHQLQYTRLAAAQTDTQGDPANFIGISKVKSDSYSVAKYMADQKARLELARVVTAFIATQMRASEAANDFEHGDIQQIDEFVSKNQSVVLTVLSGIRLNLVIYRQVRRNKYEVEIVMSVNASQALKEAKAALQEKLAKQSQELAAGFEKILIN